MTNHNDWYTTAHRLTEHESFALELLLPARTREVITRFGLDLEDHGLGADAVTRFERVCATVAIAAEVATRSYLEDLEDDEDDREDEPCDDTPTHNLELTHSFESNGEPLIQVWVGDCISQRGVAMALKDVAAHIEEHHIDMYDDDDA